VRISVVIPAFNVEGFVGRAIESVLSQGDPDLQVVVVDDGSTDATGAVAEGFDSVEVVHRANGGLASARNAGAAASTGDAIFFLDADDELLPGALSMLRAAASDIAEWSAIIPNCIRVGSEGRTWAWPPSSGWRLLDRRDVRPLIVRNRLSPHALVRRDVWARLRYREGLRAVEDLDLWLRMLLGGHRVVVLGTPGVLVRRGRAGSLSGKRGLMRRSRRSVFGSVWRRHDLTLSERLVTAYQLARTTAGSIVSAESERISPNACLQVYLDDAGGGPRHVSLLQEALGERVACRALALRPERVRGLGVGWIRAAVDVALAARPRTIVHAHGVRAAAVALPGAMLRRRPLVVTIHGLHAQRGRGGRARRELLRLVLRRARRVLVLSESDRTALLAANIVPADRISRIRVGFRPLRKEDRSRARRRLHLSSDDLAVVWLGRMTVEKDPITFGRAIGHLSGDAGVVGVVAGDGPLRPAMERLGEDARMRVLGWVDDPSTVLAAADVFVNTSRWEGMPLAVLEAGAMGVPLVLSDVPGNRDVMQAGVPAMVVPAGDAAALAAAIEGLEADRLSDIGTKTRDAVDAGFASGGMADDVLAVYEGIA
jgi:glycosyltransferase involved in cell wall biosynthesis